MIQALKEQAGSELGRSVHFHSHQPMQTILRVIQESDLAITSLAKGVIQCAYPSKTMSYMEAGTRTLAILEQDSQLAQLIAEQDLGSVCASDSTEIRRSLQAEIGALSQMGEDEKRSEKARIRKLGRELFGQPVILDQWSGLLREIEG